MDEVVEPFRLADLTLAESSPIPDAGGLTLLHRQGDRARVLIDREGSALDHLRDAGATDISESRVNLEELFLSLLKK